MSDNKEDEFSLRDKIANEIIAGLIANWGSAAFLDVVENSYNTRNIEKYIDAAYKIADLMRKCRLKSFT